MIGYCLFFLVGGNVVNALLNHHLLVDNDTANSRHGGQHQVTSFLV